MIDRLFGPYPLPKPIARAAWRIFGRSVPAKMRAQRKSVELVGVHGLPHPLRGRSEPRFPGLRRVSFPFLRVAGREWYFPTEVVLWAKGEDVGLTVWPVQRVRMWLFDRCEGCGERFPWRYSPVCTLEHEHRPHTRSVVWARTGRYHHGCAHDQVADYRSTQRWDRQWGHDVYLRRTVLNEPVDVAVELAALAGVRRDADELYMRRLSDSRRERMAGDFAWKFPREDVR